MSLNITVHQGDTLTIGPVAIRLNDVSSSRGGKRMSISIDAPREMLIGRESGARDGYDHSGDDELLAAMLEERS